MEMPPQHKVSQVITVVEVLILKRNLDTLQATGIWKILTADSTALWWIGQAFVAWKMNGGCEGSPARRTYADDSQLSCKVVPYTKLVSTSVRRGIPSQ